METISVSIVNPKAKKILKSLEDLKLITISKTDQLEGDFTSLLQKLRSHSSEAPSFDEISKEVEIVRNRRYANKAK